MRENLRRPVPLRLVTGYDEPPGIVSASINKRHLIRFPILPRSTAGVMEMDLIVAAPAAWASSPESSHQDWQLASTDDSIVVAYRAVL